MTGGVNTVLIWSVGWNGDGTSFVIGSNSWLVLSASCHWLLSSSQLLEPMTNEVPSPFHPTDQSGQCKRLLSLATKHQSAIRTNDKWGTISIPSNGPNQDSVNASCHWLLSSSQLLEPMTNEVPSPFHPTDQSGHCWRPNSPPSPTPPRGLSLQFQSQFPPHNKIKENIFAPSLYHEIQAKCRVIRKHGGGNSSHQKFPCQCLERMAPILLIHLL